MSPGWGTAPLAVLWLRARMVPCMGGLCWSHPVPSWDQWLMLLLGHKPWRGGVCVYHCRSINNAAEMLIIRELFNLAGTSRAGSSSWKLKLA